MSPSRRPETRRRRGPRRGSAPPPVGVESPASAGPHTRERHGDEAGVHLVAGERAVLELLRGAPSRVRELLVERERALPSVRALASTLGLPIAECERDRLESLVGEGLARGVVAVATPPRAWALGEMLAPGLERGNPAGRRLIVALDEVMDPHNLGAVIRSAEFFGAAGLIRTRDRAAPLSTVAVRASAGATERLPIATVTNLRRALDECKAAGWWVIGTVAEGGQSWESLTAADLPDQLVLVFGSEERGLRELTRKGCDYLATIEGSGGLGSLNVASAAAIAVASLSAPRAG